MMTTSVPITLAHHVFPKVSIVANPNYETTGEPVTIPPIESALTVGAIDGETHRFVIELYVKVDADNNPRVPYFVDIVCAAQAILAGDIPDGENPNRAMAEIGHRLLFPAVRELILSLTARQPWGQFSIGLGVLGKGARSDPDGSNKTEASKPRIRPVHSKPTAGKMVPAATEAPSKRVDPRRPARRKRTTP